MRAMLLFTAATLPLAACDIQKTSGDDKSVNITAAENGAVSFQVPGVKGNIKLPSSMMAHSDMDIDGVKLFPGSHVTNVRAEDQDVMIGFTSPGTVAELKAYYARGIRRQEGQCNSARRWLRRQDRGWRAISP